MKSKILKLAVAAQLLTALTTTVAASTGGGNGGDVFICKDPSKNVVLDYYEGLEKGMFKSFGDSKLTLEENFLEWIKLLERTDTSRAIRFKQIGLEMINDIKQIEAGEVLVGKWISFTDGNLTDISDSEELVNPVDCVKYQIAIQTDQKRGEKLLKIQRQLWNQIPTNQQAVMLAHELVYRDFISKGATDSKDARYYNQMVMSGEIDRMNTLCDYYNFITGLKDNFRIDLKYPGSKVNFGLTKGLVCDGSLFSLPKDHAYRYQIDNLNIVWVNKFEANTTIKNPLSNPVLEDNLQLFQVLGVLDPASTKLVLDAAAESKIDVSKFSAPSHDISIGLDITKSTNLSFDVEADSYRLNNVRLRLARMNNIFVRNIVMRADLIFLNGVKKVIIHGVVK